MKGLDILVSKSQTDNMTTTARIDWTSTMQPLANSDLWPALRNAATDSILSNDGSEDFGISSSDINHTIFGVAEFILRNGGEATPAHVLSVLRGW